MMEVKCLALKDLSSPARKHAVIDGTENEQKENICTERRKSTPLNPESTVPISFFTNKAPTPEIADITPIKQPERGVHVADPWTPTANLKMLISAASPDIRDREMRKVLFRPIENERENTAALPEDANTEESCQLEVTEEGTGGEGETKPKHVLVDRKQKSLGLLCHKFLALYPDYPPANEAIRISLDEVATSLSVERRRIYDIINVLESLMIVGRIAKNRYTWYGRSRLRATLGELQRQGRQQGYHLHMEQAADGREVGTGVEATGDTESCNGAASNRKDKSLRIMSQKFVMLFLVSKTHTVTLDLAAKILIEESQDSSSHSKYKTKVRRLYDIANVLTSLGLIKKVHVREEWGRKPAFEWIGPVEFTNADENRVGGAAVGLVTRGGGQTVRQLIDQTKPRLARYASFNVTPTSAVAASQRLVSSAPSSPARREQTTGLAAQPVDYFIRTTSNSTVCPLPFGKSTDDQLSAGVQTYTHSPFTSALSHHHPHLQAYLSSLSQPSVVMLYGAETLEPPPPEERRKRERDEEEEEERCGVKRRGESDKPTTEAQWEARDASQAARAETLPQSPEGLSVASGDREVVVGACNPAPSHLGQHYLYVPNNAAGLSSFNFLLPAGQSPVGGLAALPPGAMPTLALPSYVLVPSSALSHYPLLANNSLQHAEADAHHHHHHHHHANLNFTTLPGMVSPAHFVVGTAAPYAVNAGSSTEIGAASSVPTPSTPEQSIMRCAPHSPRGGSSQPIGFTITEPLTPHTQKEAVAPGCSKAFFQTPGTLGGGVGVNNGTPVARKRASAQRRLDIGHQAAN